MSVDSSIYGRAEETAKADHSYATEDEVRRRHGSAPTRIGPEMLRRERSVMPRLPKGSSQSNGWTAKRNLSVSRIRHIRQGSTLMCRAARPTGARRRCRIRRGASARIS
jgi:hypothetical protein